MSTRQIKVDPSKPPSFDLFCAWTKANGFTDDDFNRAWWNEMENISYWRAKKTGAPIHHWPALFDYCYKQAHRVTRREKRAEQAEQTQQRVLSAKEAKVAAEAKVNPALWALCRERCAFAPPEGECGCRSTLKIAGCPVPAFPPDKHPVPYEQKPSEECPHYRKGTGEGTRYEVRSAVAKASADAAMPL